MASVYETAANETIPAVRSYMAKELVNTHNLSEEKVGELLDVAQAAVSKYVNGKSSKRVRAVEKSLDKKLIDRYVEKIAQGDKRYVSACICTVCRTISKCECAFSKAKTVKI
ncbi:MAG: hypothetical protein KGH71_01140 [Candidatus Micrarchaeota archaeon]|nr:hypothetical protein [Candidatus Micrarchaeota archaeon]